MKTSQHSVSSSGNQALNVIQASEKDPSLKFMRAFRQAENLLNLMESALIRQYDLTPTQFAVLDVLYSHPESTVQFILEHALTTSGNIGVVLGNLQKRDLICQHPDEKDRRSKRVSLTDKGTDLFEIVYPAHTALLHSFFASTPQCDLEQAEQFFRTLRNDLKSMEENK